jgi:hypothetical protein
LFQMLILFVGTLTYWEPKSLLVFYGTFLFISVLIIFNMNIWIHTLFTPIIVGAISLTECLLLSQWHKFPPYLCVFPVFFFCLCLFYNRHFVCWWRTYLNKEFNFTQYYVYSQKLEFLLTKLESILRHSEPATKVIWFSLIFVRTRIVFFSS